MTGADLKNLRWTIGEIVYGRRLSLSETAKLCGLAPANGADTIRKWEEGDGPSGPVAALLEIFSIVCDTDKGSILHEAMLSTILRRLE